jgi:hypothetical protein
MAVEKVGFPFFWVPKMPNIARMPQIRGYPLITNLRGRYGYTRFC